MLYRAALENSSKISETEEIELIKRMLSDQKLSAATIDDLSVNTNFDNPLKMFVLQSYLKGI